MIRDAAQTAESAALTVPRETAEPSVDVIAGRTVRLRPCLHCEDGTRLDERDAGQQVKDARRALRMTATDLARRLDRSSSYLVDLESGRRSWTRAFFAAAMAELDRVRAERAEAAS